MSKPQKNKDEYTEEEANRKRDEALRYALNTPPIDRKKNKKKPAK